MMLDWPGLGWGLLLLAAFVGWRHFALRAVLPKAPWEGGLDAAWDVVFTALFGGVANLLHLFSRPAASG